MKSYIALALMGLSQFVSAAPVAKTDYKKFVARDAAPAVESSNYIYYAYGYKYVPTGAPPPTQRDLQDKIKRELDAREAASNYIYYAYGYKYVPDGQNPTQRDIEERVASEIERSIQNRGMEERDAAPEPLAPKDANYIYYAYGYKYVPSVGPAPSKRDTDYHKLVDREALAPKDANYIYYAYGYKYVPSVGPSSNKRDAEAEPELVRAGTKQDAAYHRLADREAEAGAEAAKDENYIYYAYGYKYVPDKRDAAPEPETIYVKTD